MSEEELKLTLINLDNKIKTIRRSKKKNLLIEKYNKYSQELFNLFINSEFNLYKKKNIDIENFIIEDNELHCYPSGPDHIGYINIPLNISIKERYIQLYELDLSDFNKEIKKKESELKHLKSIVNKLETQINKLKC